MSNHPESLQDTAKGKDHTDQRHAGPQFEETERASEPDMVGMLDYQTRNFKQLSSIS